MVLVDRTPYIVDDTYWTLECHRRGLGRIVYQPSAVASVQDPTTARQWYRQNLRWLWGTMQGIVGHRVGRRLTRFDAAYLGVIIDWVFYVVLWPVVFLSILATQWLSPLRLILVYLAGYVGWSAVGAVALRRWRLIPLFPFLIVVDWLQRLNFVHAAWMTYRRPTVESCTWRSPQRYTEET